MLGGSNAYGQLGITRSTTDSGAPVLVAGGAGVASMHRIGTMGSATCASLRDGTAVCWGAGSGGQLGDGTTPESRYSIGAVGELDGAVDLATGLAHSCALLDTGEVSCWGQGIGMGIGITDVMEFRSTPMLATGVTDAIRIDAHGFTTCVLHATGTVSCWGAHPVEGTIMPTAVAVPGIEGAREVAVGASHVCVVTQDRHAACVGSNTHGQIGDGTTEMRRGWTAVRAPE